MRSFHLSSACCVGLFVSAMRWTVSPPMMSDGTFSGCAMVCPLPATAAAPFQSWDCAHFW